MEFQLNRTDRIIPAPMHDVRQRSVFSCWTDRGPVASVAQAPDCLDRAIILPNEGDTPATSTICSVFACAARNGHSRTICNRTLDPHRRQSSSNDTSLLSRIRLLHTFVMKREAHAQSSSVPQMCSVAIGQWFPRSWPLRARIHLSERAQNSPGADGEIV
jgi:hypothetical protein